jgi:hypothetical protein
MNTMGVPYSSGLQTGWKVHRQSGRVASFRIARSTRQVFAIFLFNSAEARAERVWFSTAATLNTIGSSQRIRLRSLPSPLGSRAGRLCRSRQLAGKALAGFFGFGAGWLFGLLDAFLESVHQIDDVRFFFGSRRGHDLFPRNFGVD